MGPGTRPSGSPWTDRQVSAAPPTNCGWVWPPGAGCSSRRPCRPWSTACWQNRPRARVGGQGRHGPLMHQRVLELGNGPNTWSTNRPAALAVSICGPSERRPTSRRERSSTSARSSGRDRPSQSSRVTTAVSPATAAANESFSPGRRARARGPRRSKSAHTRRRPARRFGRPVLRSLVDTAYRSSSPTPTDLPSPPTSRDWFAGHRSSRSPTAVEAVPITISGHSTRAY